MTSNKEVRYTLIRNKNIIRYVISVGLKREIILDSKMQQSFIAGFNGSLMGANKTIMIPRFMSILCILYRPTVLAQYINKNMRESILFCTLRSDKSI